MGNLDSNAANTSALLDLYMYLDQQDENFTNMTIGEILDHLGKNEKINQMEEYKVLSNLASDSKVKGMRLISQSHYDNRVKGNSFFKYSGDTCMKDPIQACAFMDSDGNMYVAYRGTGDGRWGDNGQGYVDADTDMQIAAREYFDHVIDKYGCRGNLYVTGHSKGGNEAQYITMTSKYKNRIKACYSFDGQGFSKKANDFFKNQPGYEDNRKKMYSINQDNDPVHNLGIEIIPDDNKYFGHTHYTDSNGKNKISYVHSILGLIKDGGIDWQKDKEGNIVRGEEGWLSKLAATVNKSIMILPEGIQGSIGISVMELINMFTGGAIDDAHANIVDFFGLDVAGIPVAVAAVNQFIYEYMCENLNVFSAVAAVIVSTVISFRVIAYVEAFVLGLELIYIASDIIKSISEIIEKIKSSILKITEEWADKIISDITKFISKVNEWLYRQSIGYNYSNKNPYIEINTVTMRSYAQKLTALSNRAKTLDRRMNGLYWQLGIDWNTLYNLADLLKAEIVLDFATRLDKCAAYLNDTAADFDRVESELSNYC